MLIISAFRNIRRFTTTGGASSSSSTTSSLSSSSSTNSLSVRSHSEPTSGLNEANSSLIVCPLNKYKKHKSDTDIETYTQSSTHPGTSLIELSSSLSSSLTVSGLLGGPDRWSLTLTPGNVAYCAIVLSAALPVLSQLFFMLYRFAFGLLYPTYRSYKALKYRNHKECARMTMYWVVFAMFTSWESVLDLFVGFWFPFYSESKILFIFWLSSAYTNGAQLIYEKVVKHQLQENEQRIDRFISRVRVLSLDVIYNLWCTFAVYAQQFMIFAVQRMQLALTEYVANRQEHAITSGDKFVQLMSTAFGMPSKNTIADPSNSVSDGRSRQLQSESSCRIEEIHDHTDGYRGNPFSDDDDDDDKAIMEIDISNIPHSGLSHRVENMEISDNDDELSTDHHDDENRDPTFVPKDKRKATSEKKAKKETLEESEADVQNNNEPKKVKRKRKRMVGIELSNNESTETTEGSESRPRTRGFLKKNSSITFDS